MSGLLPLATSLDKSARFRRRVPASGFAAVPARKCGKNDGIGAFGNFLLDRPLAALLHFLTRIIQ
ncbi:hypothetical protein [Caballeronia temeraria]|uniref:hypothetical protein n=1 Tax=Caballeronia temeraria TaxID=1777137 RepID=UPI001428AD07|nr:hypothetical protein [Caballeronia temeraria]